MTKPEDAVEQARAQAAEMRAAGGYGEDVSGYGVEPERVTIAKLFEWAVIEPDVRAVYSTRRFGAPMTALKRLLVRLLAQYHAELNAQQTRFNLNVAARLRDLERRLDELESER